MSGDSTGLKLKFGSNNADDTVPIAQNTTTVEISVHRETPTTPPAHSTFSPTAIITTSSSVDTINGTTLNLLSGPSSPSNLSSITLVGSTGSGSAPNEKDTEQQRKFKYSQAPTSPLPERKRKPAAKDDENKIEIEPKAETTKTDVICSKPKIISAVEKSILKDDGGGKSFSAQSTPSKVSGKVSSNVLQPMSYLTMNRRPSGGALIGVPVAALQQHRRSLQLNSSEGGFGMPVSG